MLKRTKAANKAVLDDVKNSLQTSVTAAGNFVTLTVHKSLNTFSMLTKN